MGEGETYVVAFVNSCVVAVEVLSCPRWQDLEGRSAFVGPRPVGRQFFEHCVT
jgi:hypothetical protein